jgi:acyl phosphate:glycerol-3-phosphate acyltransferase
VIFNARRRANKMTLIVFVLMAYLLGSISFGVLGSRLFHLPDPRSYGSKNPGATNVLRSGKQGAALFTLVGDVGKGWAAVALARYLGSGVDVDATALTGLAVFLGHLFPIFLGFKGGKGVATALGVLLGFDPWMGLLSAAIWITVAVVWRISSLAALAAAALAPIYALFFLGLDQRTAVVFIMSLLLIWRHKSNIESLLSGTEPRIGKQSTL